jgi:GNAT superfamily N-acetyltransferase
VKFQLTTTPGDSELESINKILRQHNQQANPTYWSRVNQPDENPRPLVVVVRDKETQVLGGLIASTQFAWLKVDIMSVAPAFQRQGFGRKLLEIAETEAIERRSKYAFLDTMSYQTPEFYRKCGYEEVGRIPDWDSHGHEKFFFRKVLSAHDLG